METVFIDEGFYSFGATEIHIFFVILLFFRFLTRCFFFRSAPQCTALCIFLQPYQIAG